MYRVVVSFAIGVLFSVVVAVGWAKHVRAIALANPVITEAKCLEIMSE